MKPIASFSALCSLIAVSALGQLPNADLQTVYPPFGKAGESVNVTVAGKMLEAISALRFNDPRITATPETTPAKPPVYPEPVPLKDRFVVSIPPDVPPGIYEVRAQGYHGLSTARPFQVLPADLSHRVAEASHESAAKALPIQPGESVYGVVNPRQVKWFKLEAKKGLRCFMTVWAERLDSKMDPEIRLFDSKDRELERSRDLFGRDPFLDFTAPEDGTYTIAVADNLYRGGGNSYFYRFEVHQHPHIDLVWPPAGLPGTKQKFTVIGRHLPGGVPAKDVEIDGKAAETLQVEIELPKEPQVPGSFSPETPRRAMLPGFEYRIGRSNTVKIGFATAPLVLEDPTAKGPMKVAVPTEIAGRFDHPGDIDTYRFTAAKGQTYWIEVYADRLGVSADPVVILKKLDAPDKTVLVAEADDFPSFFRPDNQDGIHLDSRDAALSFTAAEPGECEVKVLNQASSGSFTHVYRLAVREAVPDFQLVCAVEDLLTATNGRAAYAEAPVVRPNGSAIYRVAAFRQDGYSGDITVTAEGLPPGVAAHPLTLRDGNDNGFFCIKAEPGVKPWSGAIRLVGRAEINGQKVERSARNATLVGGEIFADSARVRTRVDIETPFSVMDEESAPCAIAASAAQFSVELNKDLEIPVKVTDFDKLRKGNLTVQPLGLRGMLRGEPNVTIAEGQSQGMLKISFKPNGNFKAVAGTHDFLLSGIGVARHRSHVSAIAKAEAEIARLKKLKDEFTRKVENLKSPPPDPASAEARKKELAEAETILREADNALKNAEKAKTDAENNAKEKDTKFVARSEIISVTVTEPNVEKK